MKPSSEDIQRVPKITLTSTDHYTESIELSNACRKFYYSRVAATADFKQKLENSTNAIKTDNRRRKNTMEEAMDKLKHGMAELMDQDLSLMEHLLNLNETIEDIKNQRLYSVSKDSLGASSANFSNSDWSVSDTDMFSQEEDGMKEKEVDVHRDNTPTRNINCEFKDTQFIYCDKSSSNSLTGQLTFQRSCMHAESCSTTFRVGQLSIDSVCNNVKPCC